MPLIDTLLEDFPKSEIWRLQTDGCQATQGPKNFRQKFYDGMNASFDFINKNSNADITPELIENIYKSAFQYEDGYESSKILQRGYNTSYGGFGIFLPLEGLEDTAGVSEAGLDELILALQTAQENKGSRSTAQYELTINTGSSGFPTHFDPTKYENVRECKEALLTHLRNASQSKDKYTGEGKIPDNDLRLTIVELASNKATRPEIIRWVQGDINNYQQELARAKEIEDPLQRQHGEINAINHFVRKLHQSHYFPDGNGRTFVFSLAILLLLQNGHGMKITENPSHYAAYSSQELLQETLHDLQHFNEYKITNAKNYLTGLEATNINQNKELIKTELMVHLNNNPLIAIAQIDELHAQILSNKLVIPPTYAPELDTTQSAISYFFYSLISQGSDPNVKIAHNNILDILKDAYVIKLDELIKSTPNMHENQRIGYGSRANPGEVLQAIVEKHKISESISTRVVNLIENYNKPVANSENNELVNAEMNNIQSTKDLKQELQNMKNPNSHEPSNTTQSMKAKLHEIKEQISTEEELEDKADHGARFS